MAYREVEPLSRQATIIIGLTVVGFMAFGLALSFYKNILFEQTLNNIAENNDDLRARIEQGQRDLEYYRSNQFKDKYAKENLNKINPDEQLLVITENPALAAVDGSDSAAKTQQQEAAYLELLRQMPIIEHWQMYLFHRDRVEELKRSFYQT